MAALGYVDNYEAVTGDTKVRNRIRMGLVTQAMAQADDATNSFAEQRLINRILDRLDEASLTELALAVTQNAVVEGATDAQLDTRIQAVWAKLVAGFTEPVPPEPAP